VVDQSRTLTAVITGGVTGGKFAAASLNNLDDFWMGRQMFRQAAVHQDPVGAQ